MNETIIDMVRQGYEFQLGPHGGLAGYFAVFFDPRSVNECDNCDGPVVHWDLCGHGMTPEAAVANAKAIALFQDTETFEPEHFKQ